MPKISKKWDTQQTNAVKFTDLSKCTSSHPKGMLNCKNYQPTSINCKGPHNSSNKTVCPAYKTGAITLQIAAEKVIPYPFATLEANAAQN